MTYFILAEINNHKGHFKQKTIEKIDKQKYMFEINIEEKLALKLFKKLKASNFLIRENKKTFKKIYK